jgi:phage-related protein
VGSKFLDTPIPALEASYDILAAESDSSWVTLTFGIPNPLTQRIPLRRYSCSICWKATPSLFTGPECKYTGADGTCTGTFVDCRTKGNDVNWGGFLGLDPNGIRIV